MAGTLSNIRTFLGWDRFTHRSERMYEFRRGIMSFLHGVAMAAGGDKLEDYEAFEEEVAREIRLTTTGKTVLETGCGPGSEAIRFLTEFGARQVIATDISFGMLEAARKKYPRLLLVQADARHLPFAENAVDVVYSNCMYHHIEVPDRKLALEESLRVSRESVLLYEIAGFQGRVRNFFYSLYYSLIDGSAHRPSVECWLEVLGTRVRKCLRRPERALVFRYVFFVLDSLQKGVASRGPVPGIDDALLGLLVCPQCKIQMAIHPDRQALNCGNCRRQYAVRDNIPVMLIGEDHGAAAEPDDASPSA